MSKLIELRDLIGTTSQSYNKAKEQYDTYRHQIGYLAGKHEPPYRFSWDKDVVDANGTEVCKCSHKIVAELIADLLNAWVSSKEKELASAATGVGLWEERS